MGIEGAQDHVPAPAPARALPAKVIGDYRLICFIASGGMGAVYLCRRNGHGGFHRLFALKRVHAHLVEDESFTQMLLDEARLAARLHHPNVVSIVDIGQFKGRHHLVMDYVEGCTLAQLLKRSTARPHQLIVPIVIDMLQGLHAAHTLTDDAGRPLHLVHRDVSPQNVLIGVDGVARLTDFGIAKAEERMTQTAAGVRKGKLEFMSPEQAMNDSDVDRRSDIFSAGVLLWNALTGRRLFRSTSPSETMHNVLSRTVPPPSRMLGGLSPVFDPIVLRALQRDRDARYASAGEMAAALRTAALSIGALEPAEAVGQWVSRTFEAELKERRAAIAEAGAREDDSRSLSITVPARPTPLPAPARRPPWLSPASATGAFRALGARVRTSPRRIALALAAPALVLAAGLAVAAVATGPEPGREAARDVPAAGAKGAVRATPSPQVGRVVTPPAPTAAAPVPTVPSARDASIPAASSPRLPAKGHGAPRKRLPGRAHGQDVAATSLPGVAAPRPDATTPQPPGTAAAAPVIDRNPYLRRR